MKNVYLWVLVLLMSVSTGIASCSDDTPLLEQPQPVVPGNDNEENEGNDNNENTMSKKMIVRIGKQDFTVTLAENETAEAFEAMLPMTVNMNELNGNEKYHYLSTSLPTAPTRPGTIQAGDLMLYGSSCVVLFYETFSTSYSYTRIGKIDNPAGLSKTLGTGSIEVTFEMGNR